MKPDFRLPLWIHCLLFLSTAVTSLGADTSLTADDLLKPSPGLSADKLLDAGPLEKTKAREVKRLFRNPPREYASAPLWVWNDMLTAEQIQATMRDLAGQNVKQVFVHPRPGLMTPYLGEEWFKLWKTALAEAGRLDMNVWIYDENSYPSGFAGGWVPELMPDARGMGLKIDSVNTIPAWDAAIVGVYRVDGTTTVDVTARVRAGEAVGEAGAFMVAKVVRAGDSPWHGNRSYVNLLTPGVTEKFLEVTLGAYDREISEHYGDRVPGVFTDEPNIRPAGGFPWCADLPDQFRQRRGYDLVATLPSLVTEAGDWRRVRHDYYRTLNELFIERWARPFYQACESRDLEFTGHYWDHEWPHCIGVPDNMAMAAWQHRPGVDTLMNQYAENTHAQFGNVRYCREISSIANQLGRKRTLVEIYGAGGWDLRFEDMKRIADWLLVLGINTLDEHLSYVTLRGARKRDHPQSFSYHEPWWPAYHVHADYMTRLSAVLSQGRQVNRILVVEPTTTAWMYQGDEPKLKALGDSFFRLLMSLESAQVEYDLGCEDVIARAGGIGGDAPLQSGWSSAGTLRVGNRGYQVVILPEGTETLTQRTRSLLNDFVTGGGALVSVGSQPMRTDGKPDPDAYSNTTVQRRWKVLTSAELAAVTTELGRFLDVTIQRATDDKGILFHHRRELADGQVLFLVNTSIEHPSRGSLRSRAGGIERWDPYTGEMQPYPFRELQSGVAANFELPPSGSLLLFLPEAAVKPGESRRETVSDVAAAKPVEIRRTGPNVLTLDYVDVTVGGETRRDQYFYAANRFVWQQHGMQQNPWDSAVQFKDELISKTFPAGSGFEASYRFTIEGAVPPDLAIVIERPDLYAVTCNGAPVKTKAGDWWLDRAFGRIAIASQARSGENVVTLRASPFTMWHELEPAYVLGRFALQPAERGWKIAPDAPLKIAGGDGGGGWNAQGHPFYAEGVAYKQAIEIADKPKASRFLVQLPRWHGAVAKVAVNGREAGWITAPPWECDVTKQVRRGGNEIEVTVIGTLKNTLGPHHGNHPLGSAWPGMFQNGPASGPPPSSQYSTVAYGLFEPFRLRHVRSD